jgi:hypothetical protein
VLFGVETLQSRVTRCRVVIHTWNGGERPCFETTTTQPNPTRQTSAGPTAVDTLLLSQGQEQGLSQRRHITIDWAGRPLDAPAAYTAYTAACTAQGGRVVDEACGNSDWLAVRRDTMFASPTTAAVAAASSSPLL